MRMVTPARVLFVVAPFGYGPAAKALILANALHRDVALSLCGSGESLAFVEHHAPHGVHVVAGLFAQRFPDQASLAAFDAIVSINHAPVLQRLQQLGLIGRTVFVDSLLPWRMAGAATGVPPGLLAHLVQDYPGAAALVQPGTGPRQLLTAPMLWPLAPRAANVPRAGVVLHLGGMTSPLAPWASIVTGVAAMVQRVAAAVTVHGRHLTVMGSAHLAELGLADPRITVLGEASPGVAAQHVASAELLITTPGIGAVFEAMSQDTPLLLLPPMNSTQLHHHRVLTARGLPGVMPDALAARLDAAARMVDWPQQTRLCLQGLLLGTDALLAGLPDRVSELLRAQHDPAAHERLMHGQRTVFGALSDADPVECLRGLIAEAQVASLTLPPPAAPLGAPARVGLAPQPDAEDDALKARLLALPKVELHVHLEGSIPAELMLQLARRNRLRLPFDDPQAFYARRRFRDFKDFSDLLLLGVQCLRTLEDFHDAVAVMGANMARQNIRYAEVTWTPQLYRRTGLSPDAILAAMNSARAQLQARWGLQLRWIPDIVRSHPGPAQAVAEWASSDAVRAAGVVALGLGGPEAGHPADALAAAFQVARGRNLPANPHAGEGAGAEMVWRTLHALQPARLGHGVSAADDRVLMAELVARGIHLEVCLTSNVRLRVFETFAQHPVKRLIEAGCSVSLNTDDPVLFGTTLTREYLRAIRQCGLDLATVRRTILAGAQASHLPAAEKEALLSGLRRDLAVVDNPAGVERPTV